MNYSMKHITQKRTFMPKWKTNLQLKINMKQILGKSNVMIYDVLYMISGFHREVDLWRWDQ